MIARVGRAVKHDGSPERVFISELCTIVVRVLGNTSKSGLSTISRYNPIYW